MNDFKHEAASTEEQYGSPTYAWYVVIILLFAYVTSFLDRTILTSKIEPNTRFIETFTPSNTFVFKVRSKGFLRYQVRLMVAALLAVGRGEWSLLDLQNSLTNYDGSQINRIAPSSGLILHKVVF